MEVLNKDVTLLGASDTLANQDFSASHELALEPHLSFELTSITLRHQSSNADALTATIFLFSSDPDLDLDDGPASFTAAVAAKVIAQVRVTNVDHGFTASSIAANVATVESSILFNTGSTSPYVAVFNDSGADIVNGSGEALTMTMTLGPVRR